MASETDYLTRQEFRAEMTRLHAQLAAHAAYQMFQRFHALDGIRNDACPACGGRVKVIETDRDVRLEAA